MNSERLAELKHLVETATLNDWRHQLFVNRIRADLPELISAYEKLQEENESFKKEACQWRSRFLDLEIQSLETIQKYFAVVDAARTVTEVKSMDALHHAVAKLHYCLRALHSGDK